MLLWFVFYDAKKPSLNRCSSRSPVASAWQNSHTVKPPWCLLCSLDYAAFVTTFLHHLPQGFLLSMDGCSVCGGEQPEWSQPGSKFDLRSGCVVSSVNGCSSSSSSTPSLFVLSTPSILNERLSSLSPAYYSANTVRLIFSLRRSTLLPVLLVLLVESI